MNLYDARQRWHRSQNAVVGTGTDHWDAAVGNRTGNWDAVVGNWTDDCDAVVGDGLIPGIL